MNLRYFFRANVTAFCILVGLGIWANLLDQHRVDAALHALPWKIVVWFFFWTFFGSLFWLWAQSWVMLFRGWGKRAGKENTHLFLILFFFNFPASYWFYWNRYTIDPSSP